MSLSFEKETVASVPKAEGLLSSTLASSLASTGGGGLGSRDAGPLRGRAESGVTSMSRGGRAYTVAQVLYAVVRAAAASHPELFTSDDPNLYDLRIADDDGLAADSDFPPIDSVVAITGIGVDAFVVCESATERPLLRVRIPLAVLSVRACESDADASLPVLTLACEGMGETDGEAGRFEVLVARGVW